jgi:exopolysaccharide biosynthesis predicted pyruvyltransferase EpsI
MRTKNGLVVSWLMELSTIFVDNSMKKCAEVMAVYTETA